MFVSCSVPVFLIATWVSVPIASRTIMGSTDMLYLSVGIIGMNISNRNATTAPKPPPNVTVRIDLFNHY